MWIREVRDMKLPAYGAGLPGKVSSFDIVPLAPAHKAGLTRRASAGAAGGARSG